MIFWTAVIKLAASAASLKGFASREARLSSRDQVGCKRSLPGGLGVAWERQDDGSASGRRPAGALLHNSPAVGEAALAADLITASMSLHVPLPPNPFLDLAV